MDELEEYEAQLQQINDAIKLQNDLKALLELTQQNENGTTSCSDTKTTKTSDPLDDEMVLFMSEIKNIDKSNNDDNKVCLKDDENSELRLEAMRNEMELMIGKKCSAPHQHSWGTISYHNAIICGLDTSTSYALDDLDLKFCVRILFTNPTHREMIPCSYFLEGDCKFDVEKCRFSHGELIPFCELKEYKEPEFNKLQRNCVVLAKLNDKLWHKGRVICVDLEEKSCRVRLDHDKKEKDFDFENLFPIFHDDDLSSGSSSDSEDSDSNKIDYFEEARRARLVEQSLLNPAPSQALGEWEKHTKGIGSKLMQKMGYVIGTGLGSNGEGIIIPISAQVLPPGRSLDHCMELREAANGDQNLFSVERKMKQAQRKQEALSARNYQRESKKTDLFSFLNDNILPGTSKASKNNSNIKSKVKNVDFKNHTVKTLNVESVKITDDIKKMEKDILKIKESINRQSIGSEIYKRLQKTLEIKNNELDVLKMTENSLHKEQTARKHKNKLSNF